MRRRFTLRERVLFQLDQLMARGFGAMIAGLVGFFVLWVGLSGLAIWLAGLAPPGKGLGHVLWMCLTHLLDGGTVASQEHESAALRAIMVVVTVGGIFVLGLLVGIISSSIFKLMQDMRKRRLVVVKHDHTVILGWSPEIVTVVTELLEANRGRPGYSIAILADHDKEEMENSLGPLFQHRRIVCRHGKPIDPEDIDIVHPQGAKAIIILSSHVEADSEVLKSMLALLNSPTRPSQA